MCNEVGVDVNRRKTVAEKIGEEYKDWCKEGIVFLNMAMGRGKTHFIIEILGEYAKKNNQKILYLVNRSKLKQENERRAKQMGIRIESYQKMQDLVLDAHFDGKEYIFDADYIVCDECHYFVLDAWNGKTDVIFDWVMKQNVTRIFMSATMENTKNLFDVLLEDYSDMYQFTIEYMLPADYSYINKIVFYEPEEYVDELIQRLPQNEKLIYFGKKIEDVYAVYQKNQKKASFICSEANKAKYTKHIDKAAINNRFKMKNQVICTTSVLDNGINIKDDRLKHIVIEFDDMVQLIQSLGRKRVGKFVDGFVELQEKDKITLYVRVWSKGQLQKFKNTRAGHIKEVDANENNKSDYIKLENKRKRALTELNNPCYYLEHIEGRMELKLNRMIYQKLANEVKSLNTALEVGIRQQVLDTLGETFIGEVEYKKKADAERSRREVGIQVFLDRRLTKEEQKDLVNMLNYRNSLNNTVYKSPSGISKSLEEDGLQYKVDSYKSNSNTYWIVSQQEETN